MTRIISIPWLSAIALMTFSANAPGQKEDDYNRAWCAEIGGIAEYRLPSRQRVDCLDRKRGIAWEMDWAKKVHECYGQARTYARQSGLEAGCILIVREAKDCRYYRRLRADVEYYAHYPMWTATTPKACP